MAGTPDRSRSGVRPKYNFVVEADAVRLEHMRHRARVRADLGNFPEFTIEADEPIVEGGTETAPPPLYLMAAGVAT